MTMKTIVVATDFSERSDRAIRRAKLLAREFDSRLHLVHVVDDDRSQTVVLAEQVASTKILEELTHTIEENDGVKCDFRVVLGRVTEVVLSTTDRDVLAIPPHQTQADGANKADGAVS